MTKEGCPSRRRPRPLCPRAWRLLAGLGPVVHVAGALCGLVLAFLASVSISLSRPLATSQVITGMGPSVSVENSVRFDFA